MKNTISILIFSFIFSFCTHKREVKNEVVKEVIVKKKNDYSLEIGTVYKGYDTSVFENYIDIRVRGDINKDKLFYLKSLNDDSLSTVIFLLRNKVGHFIIAANNPTVLPYGYFGMSGGSRDIKIEGNSINFSVYWGISNFRLEHISTFVFDIKKNDWYLDKMEFIEQKFDFGNENTDEIKIVSENSTVKTKKDFGEISFSKFNYDSHSINIEE